MKSQFKREIEREVEEIHPYLILAVIFVIGVLFLFIALSAIAFKLPLLGSTTIPANIPVVTLNDIISGKFPSALDKNGTGGMIVRVRNLKVVSVLPQPDGDWHVVVTGTNNTPFITEITPLFQAREGMPQVGRVIDETGTPYCDFFHAAEEWHGYTCWEIHPVTAWRLSGG